MTAELVPPSVSDALALPNVAGFRNLEAIDPTNLVDLIVALEAQLDSAQERYNEALRPIFDVVMRARALVKGTITDNGGKALANETFDAVLEEGFRRDKRVDVLRRLESVLPSDLYRKAVYVKTLDVSEAPIEAVEAAVDAGAKPAWEANLVKLDKYARDYGGEIAAIVAEGSPRVEVGEPKLVIRPRESALKAVKRTEVWA